MNENEKNKYNIEIGSIIRNYRKNKKITQIKLAEKVGLGKVSIQKYESGERAVPFNVLVNIFQELNIDMDVLKRFFKNQKITEFKSILSSLSTIGESKKRIKQILLFIDYFESLGFSFYIADSFSKEYNIMFGTPEDFIRNPKIVIIKAPDVKDFTFNIGIKDFLQFLTLYSTNNIKNLYNFLEIYHLDRNNTINDPLEIDRMEDLFIKYPLTQKSNFEKVFEKLEELGEKKEGV
jgi:Helix-turn-helix.